VDGVVAEFADDGQGDVRPLGELGLVEAEPSHVLVDRGGYRGPILSHAFLRIVDFVSDVT